MPARYASIRYFVLLCAALVGSAVRAHDPAPVPAAGDGQRAITFPDTATHLTLVVDLHTHSSFSDGHVWPGIRVAEALADGLDALAITEHLEWQPHLADIPHPDRNRAFEIAVQSLPAGSDLIVIAGSEITRLAPYGHMNAIFIQDANALVRPGTPPVPFDAVANFRVAEQWPVEAALDAASDQGAFVFWNHSWGDFANRKTELTEFHRKAAAEGKLHGIEIVNGDTYSPESFQIALDHGLTPMGVSDVHNLIDWDYTPHAGGHRPVNLVFASERSAASIRDALDQGRTVVWFGNDLIGRAEHLQPLLAAALTAGAATYPREGEDVLELTLTNSSDAVFRLENLSAYTLVHNTRFVDIPAHGSRVLALRTGERLSALALGFRVLNALTAPGEHAQISFEIKADPPIEAGKAGG